MTKIDILTIFPEYFTEVFDFGIIRRAREAKIVEIKVHDLREYTTDKHRKVDDRPFGGGEGMVMKCEPIFRAVEDMLGTSSKSEYPPGTKVILLTPQGTPLEQNLVRRFADECGRMVVICGRYEGVDERVSEALVTDEISIGDYVLSGGEPAALVLTDALVRLLPEALGNVESAEKESFSDGVFDYPNYTQPRNFRGLEVPEVLLGGNHAEIDEWRRNRALEKTKRIRKDLFEGAESDE